MIGVVGVIPTRTIPDRASGTGFLLLITQIPTFGLVDLEDSTQKSRFSRVDLPFRPRRVILHHLFPRSLIRRPLARMPSSLAQTYLGSLLRNSHSRITGLSIRRHLVVTVRTTLISNTNSNINSHRTYTSITPRSRSRHRYRVQQNHLTHQREWQPTTTTSSERPPQPPRLHDDSHKREEFVRRSRRRKGEEPDRVREGFMGMSWKASLSSSSFLHLPLFRHASSSSSSLPLPSLSDYDSDYDYDHFPLGNS
jgi:hypothetical protein